MHRQPQNRRQFFKVVSREGQSIDEDHFRDTVLLLPGDEIDIGLVALDTGTWAFHCHIQEHAEAGLMTLVDVSNGPELDVARDPSLPAGQGGALSSVG